MNGLLKSFYWGWWKLIWKFDFMAFVPSTPSSTVLRVWHGVLCKLEHFYWTETIPAYFCAILLISLLNLPIIILCSWASCVISTTLAFQQLSWPHIIGACTVVRPLRRHHIHPSIMAISIHDSSRSGHANRSNTERKKGSNWLTLQIH